MKVIKGSDLVKLFEAMAQLQIFCDTLAAREQLRKEFPMADIQMELADLEVFTKNWLPITTA